MTTDQGDFSPILVPVDFSPYSMCALEKTVELVERIEASIIALHVIHAEVGVQALAKRLKKSVVVPAVNDALDGAMEAVDDDGETVLDDQREQACKTLQMFLPPVLANYPLELRVGFGRPFERIVETAIQEDIGLIVMGTHGRTGLAHIALGSTAERVVRLAPCSVLTVKAPTPQSERWLQAFYTQFLGIDA